MSGSGKQNSKPSSSIGSSQGGAEGNLRDLFAGSQATVSGSTCTTAGVNNSAQPSSDAPRSLSMLGVPGYLSNAEGIQAAVSGSGSFSMGNDSAESSFRTSRSISMRGVMQLPGALSLNTDSESARARNDDRDNEDPGQSPSEEHYSSLSFAGAGSESYCITKSAISLHPVIRTNKSSYDNGKAGAVTVHRIPSVNSSLKRPGELSPLKRSSLGDEADVPRAAAMAGGPADSTLEVLSSAANLKEPQPVPARSRPLRFSTSLSRVIGKTRAAEDGEENSSVPRNINQKLTKLRSLPVERRATHDSAGGESVFHHQSDDDVVRSGIYNVANLISPLQKRRQTRRLSGELNGRVSAEVKRVYRPSAGSFMTIRPSSPSAIQPRAIGSLRRPAGSSMSFSAGLSQPQFKRSDSSNSNGGSRRLPHPGRRMTAHAPSLHRSTTMPDIHPSVSRAESTNSRFAQPDNQQPTPAPQKLGIARKTVHYLSLVVAEHPVEKHRQFQQQLQQHRKSSADLELGPEWGQSALSATLQGIQTDESEALVTSKAECDSSYHSNGSWLDSSNVFSAKRQQLRTSNLYLSQTCSDFAEVEIPLARLRWLNAIETIISSRELVYYANIMANDSLPGEDRFYAVVRLECMLIGYSSPCKRRVVNVLTNTARRKRTSHVEKLKLEIVITGERMLEFFTPATMNNHRPYFSYTYAIVVITIFFYMAGEYALQQHLIRGVVDEYGPRSLLSWILSVWDTSGDKEFDIQYLHLWGSRYAPDLENGEFYRWFTSVAVHRSFGHLFANVVLTLSMSLSLETKYGAWRIALVWFMSCLGGQFLSATTEDPCSHVVGASGGVFGMIGLFVADMLVNFQTIHRPLLRCLLIFGICATFAGKLIAQNENNKVVSHLSHVGGLVCGLFLSFLFLPKLRKGRHHLVLSVSGVAAFLAFFAVLPAYLYLGRIPGVICPDLSGSLMGAAANEHHM